VDIITDSTGDPDECLNEISALSGAAEEILSGLRRVQEYEHQRQSLTDRFTELKAFRRELENNLRSVSEVKPP
jgi:hypothetical protein